LKQVILFPSKAAVAKQPYLFPSMGRSRFLKNTLKVDHALTAITTTLLTSVTSGAQSSGLNSMATMPQFQIGVSLTSRRRRRRRLEKQHTL